MTLVSTRMGSWLAPLTLGFALLLPLLNMVLWLLPSSTEFIARHLASLPTAPLALTPRALVVGAMLASLQLFILSYGLWAMARVFKLFAHREPFQAGAYVQRFGYALLLAGGLSPLFRTLLGLVITFDNPLGQRILMISFSLTDLMLALVGVLLVMLGYALQEAAVIAEENRQIV